jgi:hypothetical protein
LQTLRKTGFLTHDLTIAKDGNQVKPGHLDIHSFSYASLKKNIAPLLFMQVMWPSTSLCDLEPGNVISEETFQLKFDRPPNYAKLALTI